MKWDQAADVSSPSESFLLHSDGTYKNRSNGGGKAKTISDQLKGD